RPRSRGCAVQTLRQESRRRELHARGMLLGRGRVVRSDDRADPVRAVRAELRVDLRAQLLRPDVARIVVEDVADGPEDAFTLAASGLAAVLDDPVGILAR